MSIGTSHTTFHSQPASDGHDTPLGPSYPLTGGAFFTEKQ